MPSNAAKKLQASETPVLVDPVVDFKLDLALERSANAKAPQRDVVWWRGVL
jgi:hypothetical protein